MQELFDDLAMKLIKERVKQMIGRNGFTPSDREDLEQEFALHLLKRLRKLKEPPQDRQGFLRRVISRYAISLIRRGEAQKRDHRRVSSLSARVVDCDGERVEMARTIPEDHVRSRLGVAPSSRLDDLELAHDTAAVLAKLPPDLRDLCERLKDYSVAEVARQLGVPRRTLRDTIGRLRRHFEEAGLRDYLSR
jgi:RNA polymerase sigma-70 factor (ECF subfamily)